MMQRIAKLLVAVSLLTIQQAMADNPDPGNRAIIHDACGVVLSEFIPDSSTHRWSQEDVDVYLERNLNDAALGYNQNFVMAQLAEVENEILRIEFNLRRMNDNEKPGLQIRHEHLAILMTALKARLSQLRGYSVEN
jgi:hypothetical protein